MPKWLPSKLGNRVLCSEEAAPSTFQPPQQKQVNTSSVFLPLLTICISSAYLYTLTTYLFILLFGSRIAILFPTILKAPCVVSFSVNPKTSCAVHSLLITRAAWRQAPERLLLPTPHTLPGPPRVKAAQPLQTSQSRRLPSQQTDYRWSPFQTSIKNNSATTPRPTHTHFPRFATTRPRPLLFPQLQPS